MRLTKARVQGYRSIVDTGYFDVEDGKTILVGPNEAGKTAILQALQKLNPPEGVKLLIPSATILVHVMMRILKTEKLTPRNLLLLRDTLLLRMLIKQISRKLIIVSHMFMDATWTIQHGID